MGRVAAIVTLIVAGIIIADILIHPEGVKAAGSQINQFWSTSVRGLLGQA
jgi:hypothetical protein